MAHTTNGRYNESCGQCPDIPQVSPRNQKGQPRHPVPMMLLARLAVDRLFHGRGLGSELLRDAMLRTMTAADIAGLRAIIVDAKDAGAKSF